MNRAPRVKSRTMRCVALCLAMVLPVAIRSHAQCHIDPATGKRECAPAPATPPGPRAPALNSRLSTPDSSPHCRIRGGDGSTGSGTLVARNESAGLVLTCAHLFDSSTSNIVVAFPDGRRFEARLADRDRAHDLAALVILRPETEPIEVSAAPPAGALSACGYGGSGQFRCVRGNVVGQATPVGATHPSTTIHGAVRSGDSGGAVLDAAGRLVGVVWGQRDGLTYATCGRPVREFLDRVLGRASEHHAAKPPADGPRSAPPTVACDCHTRFAQIDARLNALETARPDTNNYVTRDESAGLVDEVKQSLHERIESRFGWARRATFIAGALGLSGPATLAVIAAGMLLRRRFRSEPGGPPPQPGSETTRLAPIAVDSPPPPQRTIPETHYVSYETDSFAKAHQWASEQVARKYPGATEVLHAQDSLIKQYLASH